MLFEVLGPMRVHGAGGQRVEVGAGSQRRLLAMLLLGANTWVDAATLEAAAWPDGPPDPAKGSVKTAVHHLRQLLPRGTDGSPRINSREGGHRLNVRPHELDAAVFADLVERAAAAPERAAAADRYRQALTLWRGDPYVDPYGEVLAEPAGTEHEPGQHGTLAGRIDAEASRLAGLRWAARDGLVDALTGLGRHEEAVALLRTLLAEEPGREPSWERLLAALHAADRRDEALGAYREARRALGTEPGPRLRRLHQRILDTDDPAAAQTLRISAVPLLPPDPLPSADAIPGAPSDARRPSADEPRPWVDWRVREPERPHRRRALLATAAVLVVIGVLAAAAFALRDGRLLGSSDPAAAGQPGDGQAGSGGPSGPTGSAAGPGTDAAETTGAATVVPPPSDANAVSGRRPIPGAPAPGASPPRLLFGLGDQVDAARRSDLVAQAPARMLTTTYTGPDDLARLAARRDELIIQPYADGFALHLVLAATDAPTRVDTIYGPACGRPSPLREPFLDDMTKLAQTVAGGAASPPLFVTVFDGVQGFACNRRGFTADAATTAYFKALKDRYVLVREIFVRSAPNALVSLGWTGGQASSDDPAAGGGASMFQYFNEVLTWSDFQSFAAERGTGSPEQLASMVRALSRYGPVMLYRYGPVADRDLLALISEPRLAGLAGDGLFAISFAADAVPAATAATRQLLQDAVRRYGRPAV